MMLAMAGTSLTTTPLGVPPVPVEMQAFFLGMATGGQRFCVARWPAGQAPRAWVLYVHPFAEEMNKSRRMASLQSRALAAQGFGVLQMDLQGCGDSDGDFGEASWAQWLDDLLALAAWALARQAAPLWWWGLRAGCLLAAEAAALRGGPGHFLFWQPLVFGSTALTQFLRLKLAGGALAGKERQSLGDLHALLQAGQDIEVAGYVLPPGVANGLSQASLARPAGAETLIWLETSNRPAPDLLPASESAFAMWRAAPCRAQSKVVTGPPFWQTVEIEDAPALILATTAAMSEASA